MRRATIDTSLTPHTVSSVPRRPARLLEVEQACSSLACHFLSSVVCCAPVCSLGTLECWGGRQEGRGPGVMCTPTQGVWQPAGCVSCELVCVCVSLVRVVIICLASTHTALVSSPSLAVLHLSTYLPTGRITPLSLKSLCGGGVPSSHPSLGLSVFFLSFWARDWREKEFYN